MMLSLDADHSFLVVRDRTLIPDSIWKKAEFLYNINALFECYGCTTATRYSIVLYQLDGSGHLFPTARYPGCELSKIVHDGSVRVLSICIFDNQEIPIAMDLRLIHIFLIYLC